MTEPPTEQVAPRPGTTPVPDGPEPRRRSWVGRHRLLTAVLVVLLALSPVAWSLGSALTDPSLGSSLSARLAEWTRDHGGGGLVSWAENTWYSSHPPATGGRPPAGAIPPALPTPALPTPALPTQAGPAPARTGDHPPGHLPAPAPIAALASPALPGEGQWHPVGRPVRGGPAMYEAFLRPDAQHTSLVAGVAWMDTTLLRAQLYGGGYIPGHGPWQHTAPISAAASRTLVAAFNSGFRMKDAEGGFASEGRVAVPLRDGRASVVIGDDGSVTVEAWHGGAKPGPGIASVRQNLGLLVDGGAAVPGVRTDSNRSWGGTVGNHVYVWRSGLGVTADGALVYVGGPGLSIGTLADLLVRAGAVRGMELDINTDWVDLAAYTPARPDAAAAPANGRDLLPGMTGTPARYFSSTWARDFLTMSAREPGQP